MSSPEKKRKTTTEKPPTPEFTTPNPSLPDDLLLSCFARISRLYYPTLSLVSKSFRTLLTWPELYKIRSFTESCLYVCLSFPPDPNPSWFTLCLKPDQTLTNKKKKYVLAAIPIPNSPRAHWSSLVAVGSDIYNFGGSIYDSPSSSVSILDCKSYTWRESPSMLVARSYAAANVIDGKIYVIGGCKDCSWSNWSNWMEVFDPKTQTWELVRVPIHGAEACGCCILKSAVIDGKVYMFGRKSGLVYKPKDGTWPPVDWDIEWNWVWFCYCVIDNVLYYYYAGEFRWYDTKARVWRRLKGLGGLPVFASYNHVKLAGYGGKMAVLWHTFSGDKNKIIWCAVIALEKRNRGEIWGEVEWFDEVLTVPKSYEFKHALSATV